LRKREIDARFTALEGRMRRAEALINKIFKELAISEEIDDSWKIDPFKYARDELDKKIIETLLKNKVMTSTQIAEALHDNRHKIGKRLQRMSDESQRFGEKWLVFDPREKDGHYRAWWVLTENLQKKCLEANK